MDTLSDDEQNFLKDLVKAARQRTTQIKWTDRDGTSKTSMLTQIEAAQLTTIARQLKVSQAEVLRKACYMPAPARTAALPARAQEAGANNNAATE